MINNLKSLCVLILLALIVALAAVTLYGKIVGNRTASFYSSEIDATCVTERYYGAISIACMPGHREPAKEQNHD